MDLVKNKMDIATRPPSYPEVWSGVSEFFILVSRALYRYKMLTVPDANTCGPDNISPEDCVATCDAKAVFNSGMYSDVFETFGYTNALGDTGIMTLLNYMCKGGVVFGDHGSASAANDPSFYSIHGTVERYLQLQRLKGRFLKAPWPERESCVFTDNVHPYTDRCAGHYANDELLFGEVDGKTFTNKGYYDYLDPTHSKNTYVYDNFAWPHCEAVGVTIN
jgi:hypothetical protein